MVQKKSKRRKNMKIQLHNKINDLLRIGKSKHEAKKEYRAECEKAGKKWNPSKSPYIHSIETAENYRNSINKFSFWLKEKRPEVWKTKDLQAITSEVCYDFLKEVDSESSAWTTSRHMAALNKTLELDLDKREGGLKRRFNRDIVRSRKPKKNDLKYNSENYKEQIDFARAFGLRRESIFQGDYVVKEISLFQENDSLYCAVIEKGGKYREARCLNEYEDIIKDRYDIKERSFYDKESFNKIYHESDNKELFDSYTRLIDNHAFRREYANKLYYQLEEEANDRGEDLEPNYRGYNKDILVKVSRYLGHNRVDVVVDYYLD